MINFETRLYTLLMAWVLIKKEKDPGNDEGWAKVLNQIESSLKELCQ